MNSFQKRIKKFVDDRDWGQFIGTKDILLGIVEEVGEIRNIIKWEQDPKKIKKALKNNQTEMEDQIGDIYWFLALLANEAGVDMDKAIDGVIKANRKRFPIKEVKSRHTNTRLGGIDKAHKK